MQALFLFWGILPFPLTEREKYAIMVTTNLPAPEAKP